ncbi:MAG: type II toxin-antitoxin system Phd/YefM family antitoxin [Candidatus Latescibacterota bacterium]
MKTISMLEFRRNALQIVRAVQQGQRMLLTYRGRPVARLQPPEHPSASDDPFHDLALLADDRGESLSNRQIDEAVYGNSTSATP